MRVIGRVSKGVVWAGEDFTELIGVESSHLVLRKCPTLSSSKTYPMDCLEMGTHFFSQTLQNSVSRLRTSPALQNVKPGSFIGLSGVFIRL